MAVRRFVLLALAVLLLAPAARPAVPLANGSPFDVSTKNAILRAVGRELKDFGGRTPIPGALVGIWLPAKPPFVWSVGYADLRTKKPFALADAFRVGSNTKTFVVSVILQLVDERRLKLDDPISRFDIGVRVRNGDHITIRQLCDMRSGLMDAYNTPQVAKMTFTPKTDIPVRTLIRWASENPPLFAPGAKYNYSNTNYLILGRIVEAVTHDSIQHQVLERLIRPYGLTGTSFPATSIAMPLPYAHGYGLDAKGAWEDVTISVPPALTGAAGAMISTVPDMKRWVKLYVSGATNSKAMQRERLRCLPTGKGSGAFGLGVGCSGGWYGYTGGLPGYNTSAFYFPKGDATIVAFVTAQRESPSPGVANAIVRDITRILFPQNVMSP